MGDPAAMGRAAIEMGWEPPIGTDVGPAANPGTHGVARQDHRHRGVALIEVGDDVLRGEIKLLAGRSMTISADDDEREITIASSASGELASLSDAEVQQLQNIGAAALSAAQWLLLSRLGASKVHAYVGTNQTIANGAWTQAQLDTEDFDVGDDFDLATYRFTAPHTGYYMATAAAWLGLLADQSNIHVRIVVDGNSVRAHNRTHTSGANAQVQALTSVLLYLTAGQYVEVEVFQSSGGARTLYAGTHQSYLDVLGPF